MANEKSELRNPLFWGLIAVVLGIALGIWGWSKGDCNSSPDCFHGSGFLKWTGGILIAAGLGIWAIFGSRKEKR